MVRVHLNLDLLNQLFLHLRLFELFLVDDLDSKCETCMEVTGHEHVAETALAEFAAELELVQGEGQG